MKKTIFFLSFMLACSQAQAYRGIFNHNTGRLDYVGVAASADVIVSCDANQTLISQGSGVWACGAGGSTNPAGSNTQVQYNDAGAFGADANLLWNKSNKTLGVGVSSDVAGGILGVGPNFRISLTTGSNAAALIEDTAPSSSNAGPTVIFAAHDGAALASGDRLGGFQWGGNRTASGTTRAFEMESFATELWTNTSTPAKVVFSLVPSGSTSRADHTTLEPDGTISVNTANYENLVTQNNDIPNRKYLYDFFADLPVSNDAVAAQAVSTDQIQATNKPTNGQVLSYNSTALKGEWITSSGTGDITDVYNCSTGDCANIVMADNDSLDAASGFLRLPHNKTLSSSGQFTLRTSRDAVIVNASSRDVAVPLFDCKGLTIVEPDQVLTVSQDVAFLDVNGHVYPNGIRVRYWSLGITPSSSVKYSLVKKTAWQGGTVTSIDLMTTTSENRKEDNSITTPNVASGELVFVDVDPTDLGQAHVEVCFDILN